MRRTGPGTVGGVPRESSAARLRLLAVERNPVDNDIGVTAGHSAWFEQLRTATRPTPGVEPPRSGVSVERGLRGPRPDGVPSALRRPLGARQAPEPSPTGERRSEGPPGPHRRPLLRTTRRQRVRSCGSDGNALRLISECHDGAFLAPSTGQFWRLRPAGSLRGDQQAAAPPP